MPTQSRLPRMFPLFLASPAAQASFRMIYQWLARAKPIEADRRIWILLLTTSSRQLGHASIMDLQEVRGFGEQPDPHDPSRSAGQAPDIIDRGKQRAALVYR